ncbi:MAG: hypothetical protein AW08_00406 [Candidatus Accumulibacter adjunctus]|uniref:DUF1622 domain-containing protein n=1 Tax=Candidatus Accumulibacter adjunctus TaxID=1454001 RepID=A0A011PS68_9PROT|nr:MAG: hypothetical protein AW08_00406 [Candidatus Accumulibacter adjunctus]
MKGLGWEALCQHCHHAGHGAVLERADTLRYSLHGFLELLALGFGMLGVLIVCIAVFRILPGVAEAIAAPRDGARAAQRFETARAKLREPALLAFAFLIAGELVGTVVVPSWEKMGILAATVVIRAFLGLVLAHEHALASARPGSHGATEASAQNGR